MAGPTDDGMPIPMPREDEVPVRRVCLDGFWLGKWEVTNSQWQRIMGVDNGESDHYPQRPKANVSWDNVQRFVGRLNQQVVEEGVRYRLPSEVEWEYACHAGSKRPAVQLHAPDRQRWTEELAKQALFREPSQSDPHTIDAGSKVANGWGLYDMLGNVWEWTADPYRADAYRHPYLPEGETSGAEETRVIRGGSYKSDLAQVRCGVRNYFYVSDRTRVIGFRLVMERDEK